ncbi:type II toxin-antitoxin system VapC family toxin [Acidobacteriota bacterium]
MKKALLDTNAYAGFLSGDERILHLVSRAQTVYMSVIVLGELHAGFRGGFKKKQNIELLNKFMRKPSVETVDISIETAEIFGFLMNNLREAGTPLTINDVWIAAHAVETGSVLVTLDSHFKKIAGLRLWEEGLGID